jgi:glutathione S-transferase
MFKIFGNQMSTCTRKVLMTLHETNAPFELTSIDFMAGEHKKDAHLARQPFGQMPALDDDGFALYESRAMCRYINDRANGKLVPTDVKARALMEQWISIETSNFTPHAMKFIYHYFFQRAQDAAVLEAAEKGITTAIGVMEKSLAKNTFIAGSEFTLADVCFMPYFEYAMKSPAKEIVAKHGHVNSWWNRISERPTWQKTAGR